MRKKVFQLMVVIFLILVCLTSCKNNNTSNNGTTQSDEDGEGEVLLKALDFNVDLNASSINNVIFRKLTGEDQKIYENYQLKTTNEINLMLDYLNQTRVTETTATLDNSKPYFRVLIDLPQKKFQFFYQDELIVNNHGLCFQAAKNIDFINNDCFYGYSFTNTSGFNLKVSNDSSDFNILDFDSYYFKKSTLKNVFCASSSFVNNNYLNEPIKLINENTIQYGQSYYELINQDFNQYFEDNRTYHTIKIMKDDVIIAFIIDYTKKTLNNISKEEITGKFYSVNMIIEYLQTLNLDYEINKIYKDSSKNTQYYYEMIDDMILYI